MSRGPCRHAPIHCPNSSLVVEHLLYHRPCNRVLAYSHLLCKCSPHFRLRIPNGPERARHRSTNLDGQSRSGNVLRTSVLTPTFASQDPVPRGTPHEVQGVKSHHRSKLLSHFFIDKACTRTGECSSIQLCVQACHHALNLCN